jgi:catechol 2,3-dioxygenase-like lactoylglutathione lyase family enzyme
MDVALGYRGSEQVELIEITSQTASPYQDAAGRPLEGLHHLAWIVDDLAAERAVLEGQGLAAVFHAANAAVEVVYLADPDAPGVLYELIAGEGQREMHGEGLARARSWDGREANVVIDFAGT